MDNLQQSYPPPNFQQPQPRSNKKLLIILSIVISVLIISMGGCAVCVVLLNAQKEVEEARAARERAEEEKRVLQRNKESGNSQVTANIPPIPSPSPTAPPVLYKPPARDLLYQGILFLDKRRYEYRSFTIPVSDFRNVVIGECNAYSWFALEIIIIPADQMSIFKSNGSYTYYYKSYAESHKINVSLPPGDYVLIFNNPQNDKPTAVDKCYLKLQY